MTLFDGFLPPPVDLHCHLGEAGGYAKAPVDSLILAVTNEPSAFEYLNDPGHERVTWSVGLHPRVLRRDDERLRDLLVAIPTSRAIGEVGLDYSSAGIDRAAQRRALDAILSHPGTQERLISIHSTSATSDVVAAVADFPAKGAVLHWFLGSQADLERAIDLEVHFSVNSAMLTSRRGRAVVAQMPPNRVLVETDAPYARRGKSALRPGDVGHAESALGRLWELETEEVRRRLWSNLSALQQDLICPPFNAST